MLVETEFLPCPRCGSAEVTWSNSRDLDIRRSYIECECCGLHTFHVDTLAFVSLPDLDYDSTLMKYNAWVKTNPKQYFEEQW